MRQIDEDLMRAAYNGEKKQVEILLSKGADIDAKENNGYTPLHTAVYNSQKEIVELLLSKGADINAKKNDGYTPLHTAVYNSQKEIVEFLLSKGADINAKDNDGWTALHFAARYSNKEVVELLLSKGAAINVKNNKGWTPLHHAALNGNKEVVELLLSRGADINAKINDGYTPRDVAAAAGNKEVAKLLRPVSSRLKIGAGVVGFLVLWFLLINRRKKNLSSSKKNENESSKEADINAKDNDGWTALHRSALSSSKVNVEILLFKGADINAKTNDGRTALHIAAGNNKEIVELLLSKGADIDAKDNDGWTPLHHAAVNGKKEVVEFLLSKGAKVDLSNTQLVGNITKTLFEKEYTDITEAYENLKVLDFFIKKGADIDAKNNNGLSPLHLAAEKGQKEIVEFLLSKGADIDAKTNDGRTPLHRAAYFGDKEVVEFLLSKGADIDAKNNNGLSPLHLAAYFGNKEIVEFLLSKGADIDAKNNNGLSPLHLAAEKGQKEVVEFLLSKGADIDAKDNDGLSPLHLAAEKGQKEVVEFLLSKGADIDAKDNDGWTPLHRAAYLGDKEIVEFLLSKGADIDAKNNNGLSPLHLAAEKGQKEIVEFLLSKGADIDAKDNDGWTPLHRAAYFGDKEVVEFLLSKGADIDAKNNNGLSPLHLAAEKGQKEVVEFLLSKGADIDAKDNDGWTPLHRAAHFGNKEIVEFLLSKGADIDAKNNNGNTPLHRAAYLGDKEVVEFLLSKGADIDAKNNNGLSPLHLAAEKGQKEIVEFLLSKGAKVDLSNTQLVGNITKTLFEKEYTDITEAYENLKVLDFFIKKGADINAKTNDGKTALHLAAQKGQKEIVEFLLSKVAKVDLSNTQLVGNITKTLFEKEYTDITEAYENLKVLDFFIKKGADINAKTNDGKTALHLAAQKGKEEIVAYLLSMGAQYERELFTTPQEYRDAKQDIIVCFKNTILPLKYKPTEDSLVLLGYKKEQQIINDLITTLAVKAALKLPDAKCELMLVDPVGLGKNCNLLYNLDKKFYQKISTTKQDVENLLSSLESYASYVHSNYLKGVYDSLAAYNHDNKEVSEATKFVIVYDYFKATDDEQKKRFQKLFGEARSVGINFILSYDIENESEAVKNIQDATTLKIESNLVTFSDDCILSVEKIMDTIGYLNGKLAKLDDVKVSYIKNKPKELWSKDSSSFIEANIGKSGRESLMFAINNQMESHALLIGRSGSGKSNLLHIMISDLVLNYSPQDIKLYLVDMKGGTEFVKYTQAGLPHLEIASITSDREMALTILKRVEGKLNEREKLFSSQGVQNIEQYNTKFAQNKEPRLLLILDEFQELFTKEDSIKREAAEIFDRVSKKGRSFGINMILASQSLGGDTLAASTVNQFAIRIVLQCSEDDSRRVLSFDNSEAKLLSKPGEGIYNAQNGSVAGNQKFQTYWLETQEHDALLQEVIAFAKEKSVETQCVVFREDLVPSFIDSYKKSSFEKSKKEIVFGQPYGFSDYVSLKLKKDDAANVLISGNSQELADQVMILFLLSLALDASSKKRFYILSSGDEEENQLQEYAQVLKSCNISIDFITKRNALEIFGELNQEIQNCIDNDVKMEVENYLFIDNGYKMRVLRKESDEYGGSKISQETSLLSSILKNGPEFGVHSFVYIESIKQFDMMFDYTTLKHDFNNIIALQMSEDDAQRLIGNYKASSLGQSNAIFVVDDTNTEVKFRPLALPPHSWVEHTLA